MNSSHFARAGGGIGKAKRSIFERLGRAVIRKRHTIVVAWVVLMLVVLVVISRSGSVTSNQQGSSSGANLESVEASNIISQEFPKAVPNSTLLIVIETKNASSLGTQQFVKDLISNLNGSSSSSASSKLRGLENTSSVYSLLYEILNRTNRAVFETFTSANKTQQLLYGVPALYLNAWSAAFNETHDISTSNEIAYNETSSALKGANATAYMLYSSHILDLFNSSWASSFYEPKSANYSFETRASYAANESSFDYIERYDQSPASRIFSISLVRSISFSDFLDDPAQKEDLALRNFAVDYVSNSSGLSTNLVNATFDLGRNLTSSSLETLAGNVIWNPEYFGASPQIRTLISSFVDSARNVTLVSLSFNESSDENVVSVRSVAQSLLKQYGSADEVYSALVTGNDALNYDSNKITNQDLGIILPVTIILLIAATAIFFRSIVTPFITLGTIGVALAVSQIFIVLVGKYVNKVDYTIPTILISVLIGVGTDYSVFILARYREERVKGLSVEEALVKSLTWAGQSIATSGATVIISFLSLSFSSVVYLQTLGLIVGLGVLVALSVALTLVPSIVSIVGERTFWPMSGRRFVSYSASVLSKLEKKRGYFSRSGLFAVKKAKALILIAFVATIPALYVYVNTTPTYDFLSGEPTSLESFHAMNVLSSSFGGGKLFPTYVVVTFSQKIWNGSSFNEAEMNAIANISSYLSSLRDVENVSGPTSPYGQPVKYSTLSLSSSLNASSTQDNQTISSILSDIGKDNKTALITVNFRIDPYDTQAISDASAIRSYLHSTYGRYPGITGIYLGGASGSILDTRNVVNSQFNSIVPTVAIGVALVLLVVLGSIFLSLFAIASVLMSIVWTLAVTKLVFEHFFSYGLLFITPLFLFVVLLGLGMDYNIFILTRIREEAGKGQSLKKSIIVSIEQTGGIITAAAVILAGSIGALMLSSTLLLKEIGFAFAFSILIDALVVRTYLVPAVMSTLGKWNWYNPTKWKRMDLDPIYIKANSSVEVEGDEPQ
jgi:RND superfamily putative drug exporter